MSKEFNFEEVFRKELVKEEILAIINEKDKKITDLEAKLAKKEKEIQILNERLKARILRIDKKEKIDLLKEVLDYFCEEEVDGDGIPTGDWVITKDAGAVAEYIDSVIKKMEGK